MGRRKIEIKAIKDDRNRSVTFLKRKGGLFKKAHELSVLCSVDVAVIVFGHNKKLHTYASGDIRDTGLHEHKSPADYQDKDAAGDDENEVDDDEPMDSEEHSPPRDYTPEQQQHQHQHLRHPSVSSRSYRASPQPGLRPVSRTQDRRASSSLGAQQQLQQQQQQQQLQQQQMQYGYQQQQSGHFRPTLQMAHSNPQLHPDSMTPPLHRQSFQQAAQAAPETLQQLYMQEHRRQSMPPDFAMQISRPHSAASGHSGHSTHSMSGDDGMLHGQHAQHAQHLAYAQPQPQPQAHDHAGASRSHSIYSPIDDSSSMLAQHWGEQAAAAPRVERAQSADAGVSLGAGGDARGRHLSLAPNIQRSRSPLANEYAATPSPGAGFPGPLTRVDSVASDTKRPRLTVQIPAGASPDGSESAVEATATAQDTPKTALSAAQSGSGSGSASSAQAGRPNGLADGGRKHSKSVSVVLPPPSPSARSPAHNLSPTASGPTGPRNPFARPPPPASQHPHAINTNVSSLVSLTRADTAKDSAAGAGANLLDTPTPMSGLPSRFMSQDTFLPSPSSMWPVEWAVDPASAADDRRQDTPGFAAGAAGADEAMAELERRMKRKVISPMAGAGEGAGAGGSSLAFGGAGLISKAAANAPASSRPGQVGAAGAGGAAGDSDVESPATAHERLRGKRGRV